MDVLEVVHSVVAVVCLKHTDNDAIFWTCSREYPTFKAATLTFSTAAPSGVAAGWEIKTSAENFWIDLWPSWRKIFLARSDWFFTIREEIYEANNTGLSFTICSVYIALDGCYTWKGQTLRIFSTHFADMNVKIRGTVCGDGMMSAWIKYSLCSPTTQTHLLVSENVKYNPSRGRFPRGKLQSFLQTLTWERMVPAR